MKTTDRIVSPPSETDSLVSTGKKSKERTAQQIAAKLNLHHIGKIFMSQNGRRIFDLCVYLHFVSILISYILAASESWGTVCTYLLSFLLYKVFGIEVNCNSEPDHDSENRLRFVILGFGLICTTAIVAGQALFTSVVSAMTAVKGTLLVLMVAVTAYVAASLDQSIFNDWSCILYIL
jgi:hypothetical protein